MSTTFDLIAHLHRQREFSLRTFGPGPRHYGVIDHIRKELREIEADPTDIVEWIDVLLLALDGAWRTGLEPHQIADAIAAKQAKNERRSWPDWRTADPNKAIEHVRTTAEAEAPTLYLSGPMTGRPDHNFPAFHAEAARLRALGYHVINPAELNPSPGATRAECLRKDIAALTTCTAIALLPDWQHSVGALLEFTIAHHIGLHILTAADITTSANFARAAEEQAQWPDWKKRHTLTPFSDGTTPATEEGR